MKYAIAILAIVLILPLTASPGEPEKTTDFSSQGFSIVRVASNPKTLNALGKMSQFSDSDQIGRSTELGKNLPPDERGEEFVIKWRYKGSTKIPQVTLCLEYVTGKEPKLRTFRKSYAMVKSGTYTIVLKNIGRVYRKRGEIAHWKIAIAVNDEVVALKQSAMWGAMANFAASTTRED
jgi:hypothetical protein